MERKDPEFELYLQEIVRRDKLGLERVDIVVSPNRKEQSEPKPENSNKLSRAIPKQRNDWPEDKQLQYLITLLSWRLGKSRAAQLATKLAQGFGTVPAVLAASDYRLLRIPGVGPQTIELFRLTRELAERLAFERVDPHRPVLSQWSEVLDYVRVKMAFETIEQFRILFLDKKNRLIADEVQQTGTIDHTPAYPREVIRRALELSATALILLHNHPSGDPAPSTADIRTTREIADASKLLGIVLHDHLIIGKSGHASLRKLNLI